MQYLVFLYISCYIAKISITFWTVREPDDLLKNVPVTYCTVLYVECSLFNRELDDVPTVKRS